MNDARRIKIVLTVKKLDIRFIILQRNTNYIIIIKVEWFLRSIISERFMSNMI